MDWQIFLNDPELQSSIIPLVLSFVGVGITRFLLGPERGARMAALGAGAGFIAIYVLVSGLPPFPPLASGQKVFWLVVAGLGLGLGFDALKLSRMRSGLGFWCLIGMGLIWLVWPLAVRGTIENIKLVALIGIFIAAGMAVYMNWRKTSKPLDLPLVILSAGIGIGGISVISASASIAQISFALAASIGGFCLWNWPKSRFPFQTIGIMGLGAPLFFLCAQLVLFTEISLIALAVLTLVFFTALARDKIKFKSKRLERIISPIILGLMAAVPALLAISTAYVYSGAS